MTDTAATLVVFRRFKDTGEIIALFPYELGTSDPDTCMSYMHVGQHGAASADLVNDNELLEYADLAPSEYADLADELRRAGYVLDIAYCARRDARAIREAKLSKAYSEPLGI